MKYIMYITILIMLMCSNQIVETALHPKHITEDIHEEREINIQNKKPLITTY